MNRIFHSRIFIHWFFGLCAAGFLVTGCKKNEGNPFVLSPDTDLSTKVSSSASGFVTDENELPVIQAIVQLGSLSATTDKYGYFEIKNAQVTKNAAVVTVLKTGYFKGIKTYIAAEGKPAFLRIKLIPKTIAGTVTGNSGGSLVLPNGLSITLPANAIVNAATNAAYTGTVNISAHWLNPTSPDLSNTMPGDLRGINANGDMRLLVTYGMAAVELTGSGGELLQIAPGKKATLSLPIPVSISATAPATIPLWYFDEAKGLWKEEGSATKTGNSYVGEVSHFSFWNYDQPGNFVQFNCTLLDVSGQPIPNALVRISVVNNPANWRQGYTNGAGYVSGAVPANEQLKLEVFADPSCTTTPLYSQTFTTTTANISLGTITINNPALIPNVSGTATDCNNAPVNSGMVILKYGYVSYAFPITNGAYNFYLPVCSTPASVSISILNLSTFQVSLPMSVVLNAGNNTIPTIQVCGTNPEEYIYYVVDGTTSFAYTGNAYFKHTLHTPTNPPGQYDQFSVYNDPAFTVPHSIISIERPPLVPAASARLQYVTIFNRIIFGMPFPNPITVTYTEYGNIGQYIAGSFSGILFDQTVGSSKNVTCSFRFKRTF